MTKACRNSEDKKNKKVPLKLLAAVIGMSIFTTMNYGLAYADSQSVDKEEKSPPVEYQENLANKKE